MNAPFNPQTRTLIVIPCLNEGRYISALLKQLLGSIGDLPARIVVADGGSEDDSPNLVRAIAKTDERVILMSNPKRIQSAGINLAVELFGDGAMDLIRLDAHGAYPASYCQTLLAEAQAVEADAVVVSMRTVGLHCFQRAVAATQNSWLGNGGASHRASARAGFVDHGHHALVNLSAFRAIGGYDENFPHNEDAEFDHRLSANGGRIWLTDKVRPIYFPRETAGRLFSQYRNHGRGRARTIRKHPRGARLRQLVMAMIAPMCLAALAALPLLAFGMPLLAALLAAPALLWATACLVLGCGLAIWQKELCVLMSGPAAMLMHLGWSLGFWTGYLGKHPNDES